MKKMEADQLAINRTLTWLDNEAHKDEVKGEVKTSRAFRRLWTRLQKVYIRNDHRLNPVDGNA